MKRCVWREGSASFHFSILLLLCSISNFHSNNYWTIIMNMMNIYRQISWQSMLMRISSVAEGKITSFSRGPADLHGLLLNPAAHCWVGETPSTRHSISPYQKHCNHCSSSSSFSTPVLQPLQRHLNQVTGNEDVSASCPQQQMCDVCE